MAQQLHLTIVSPAKAVFDGEASLVEIPGVEGDFGVLPGHAPFFSMIRPGVITVHRDSGNLRYFVSAGYADVSPEATTILSESLIDLAGYSAEAALAQREAAAQAVADADSVEARQRAEQALAAADVLVAAVTH